MPRSARCLPFLLTVQFLAMLLAAAPALALQPRSETSRFDRLALPEPGTGIAVAVTDVDRLSADDPARAGWQAFSGTHGRWQVWLDPRSGLPALAIGTGIPWVAAAADGSMSTSAEDLAGIAQRFLEENANLLGAWGGQLELDRDASGAVSDRVWQLVFRHVVGGVPVQGSRFEFQVSGGRLVAFGTARWGAIGRSAIPKRTADDARVALDAYLGWPAPGEVEEIEPTSLRLVAVDPKGARAEAWSGPRGQGYDHALVYRFALRVPGEPATWIAEVDADTGSVLGFHDDTRYGGIVGGVYPVSDDQSCPTGCEQRGWPMPYADFSENAGPVGTANDQGLYTCSTTGASIRTTLAGPYIKVHDNCGAISQTTTCDTALDLLYGPGTDCEVPAGSSLGNTHASRSSFYHLNRAMEKGRAWLPDNTWLRSQVTDNVNINATCNAYWNGSVNFYKSGGGCRNTGEIAGVFVHEWGHGLDANDGGGYDNPSEAYADIVAFLETRESCVGRGFFIGQNCDGYGDACLNCTGIRDQDWDKHVRHEPATPGGFIVNSCPGGDGPCGREGHCESYLVGETVWDLAARDLPASGLDAASAWQLAEKLFYVSRKGSGGAAYNCAPPTGNGCGTSSWFHKFRVVDDDDGNLANGTPHAAAIFAAFDRHGIACGLAGDASNQSSGACPPLARPDAAAIPGDGDVQISWSAVPGAASYSILRSDIGCDRAQVIVDKVAAPGTVYLDAAVSPNRALYYRVQAVGNNTSCESPVSDCASTAGEPNAGAVRFDATAYGCGDTVGLRVVDGNTTASTVTVTVASDTETVPETVTLAETVAGSHTFVGTMAAVTGAAISGDGAITVSSGDLLTVTYRDVDNGAGAASTAFGSARVDCVPPDMTGVQVVEISDDSAVVRWTTSKPSSGRVDWGGTPALGQTASSAVLSTSHALTLKPLGECGRFYFRVSSADAYGNTRVVDAAGAPLEFNANKVPGVLRRFDFESSTGWTLEGEWQIGAPQGSGASPGDPHAAFKGTGVLGHDLTGLGAHPGDYEAQRTERAISPVIDASTLVQGQLKFRRWLNTYGGIASVKAKKNGVWTEVWNNYSVGPVAETDWSLQSLDIASLADGNAQLQISFEQNGGPNATNVRSGWNVDQMLIKFGNTPDYDACGACGGAPTFSGALRAEDVNACADDGVRVVWSAAPAWGTGRGGTYSVYRSTQPDFVPGAANRVTAGVAGTSWIDTTAPNDVLVYYVVRAENDETCSTGPANGGVTETNTVRVSVKPTTIRSLPVAVGGLAAGLLNGAAVHLTWNGEAEAASYRVYRSASPSGGWQSIGSSGALLFDDVGAGTDSANWYYTVRAVNACGQEGP